MALATSAAGERCEGQTVASPLHKGINHQPSPKGDDHHVHNDLTSRTSQSLTLCDSWDVSATANAAGGVEIPPVLSAILGVDFLPFSPSTPPPPPPPCRDDEEEDEGDETREEIKVPPMDVPRSVEITPPSPEDDSAAELADDEVDEVSSIKSCHKVLSPAAPASPEETQELQQLLIESNKKKKAPGLRFRRAARAVLQRVKSGRKTPPSIGSKSRRGSISSRRRDNHDLAVETDASRLDQQLGNSSDSNNWISPMATGVTDGTLSPLTFMDEAKEEEAAREEALRRQTLCLRSRAEEQEKDMKATHAEIEGLQSQLAATITRYQAQLSELQATQEQLFQLASSTELEKPEAAENSQPKEEPKREFKRSESGTFMRVHDLDLSGSSGASEGGSESLSVSSLSHSAHNGPLKANQQLQVPTPEFLLMDQYLLDIVHQLMGVGFDLATDETDRFVATRDTARLLSQMPTSAKTLQNGWPIEPWTPAWDQHVLVWMGKVSHEGFGHNWPVVKGRTILHTSAQNVLEYLWDSTLVPKYNPMCQGRQDLYILQDDVHMTEKESPYGFPGCAKIVRSVNKHRLLPKAIEMKILLYARPLEQHAGSYILVSRSVWENDTATLDSKVAKTVIRTEMLMGCTIVRAIDENACEMTNLTHVHSPGVPELLARKASPGQCHGLMKTFQSLFPPPKR